MLKRLLVVLPILLVACVANYGQDGKKAEDAYLASVTSLAPEEKSDKVLKTREDVKALFYKPDPWLEANFDGRKFLFCANDWISSAIPVKVVHGWVFRRMSKDWGGGDQWKRVFAVQLIGARELKFSVNRKTGGFSARGAWYSKPERDLFTFDLNATE